MTRTTYSKSQHLTDMQRIARSLQRATIIARYSHGTVKRQAMAMINYYLKLAGTNFAASRSHPRQLRHTHHEMHVAM